MKYYRELLMAVLIGVIVYLVFFKPGPIPEDEAHVLLIDSLARDKRKDQKEIKQARDSIKELTILANTWFNEAMKKEERLKLISKTKHAKDTAYNRATPQSKRDSLIRATFYKN